MFLANAHGRTYSLFQSCLPGPIKNECVICIENDRKEIFFIKNRVVNFDVSSFYRIFMRPPAGLLRRSVGQLLKKRRFRSPRQIPQADRGRDGRDDDVGDGCHRVSDPSPTTRVATHLDAREVGKLNVRANLHASRESHDAHRPRAGLEGVSRARDRFRHFGGTNQRTCRKRTISSRDRRSARDRVKNRCG